MNTGSVLAQFTITLSKAVNEHVAVEWFTSDGTAKSGVDYAANKGTAVFAPGENAKKIDILVYGRAVGTEDRSFFVEMLPPTNAILGASIGECIIHVDTSGSQPVTQIIVPTGPQGIQGKSAYQSYLDTTTDNPPMTEPEWVNSLKGDPQEIAQEVATLIDVGNTVLTAEGTESLVRPDQTTVKAVARRVAYAGSAKIANVTLADGDNAVAPSNLTGDTIDLSSEGLCPRILRGSSFITPVWSVQPDGKILIRSAVAGDVLYLCQYDFASGSKNLNSNTREQWRRTLLLSGITLVDGSFETGASVTSKTQAVWHEAGGQCYMWTGTLPKTVNAATTPGSDPLWKAVPRVIGLARSFAELRTIMPESAGQRILLASYYAGGLTGGGEFIARSTVGMSNIPSDDGGVIATVSTSWYWERVDLDAITVDCFGAHPYTVPIDGSVPVGAVSSSDAFQRMLNSVNKIVAADAYGVGYLIDTPIMMVDMFYSKIDHKMAVIQKTATTKTGLAEYIAAAGSYVEGNVNCVYFILRSRYWEIQGGYLDCHLAPSGSRPVGIYIAEAVGYKIEKVLTRGCKHGLWVKSGWLGEINLCRFSENTNHGVFYDSSRYTSTGATAAVGQTATSLHISSSYVAFSQLDGWHLERCQYTNLQAVACDGAGSVAGGSAYYFSECDVVGDIGAESPSSSAEAYLKIFKGSANLSFNCYDTIDTPAAVVVASGGASAILHLSLRTQRQRLFTISDTGNSIRVPRINFWNGQSTNIPDSVVAIGSTLEIDTGIMGRGVLNYAEAVSSYHKESSYRGQNLSSGGYENFRVTQHKKGFFGPNTTFQIPLSEINAAFPSLLTSTSVYREIFKVRVNSYQSYADGVTFSYDGSTLSVNTANQVVYGGAGMGISSMSISGGNLVITLASSQSNVTFTISPL